MSENLSSTPKATTLSPLDSPSSYVNASKSDKAAIKAAYSEIFRIPKKKRRASGGEGGNSPESKAGSPGKGSKKKKSDVITGAKTDDAVVQKTLSSPKKMSPSPTKAKEESNTDPFSILRKGDLVKLDSEQTRSGRIQGGLARVTRVHPSAEAVDYCYDIEYVLGGKVSSISREELVYTTAEAEGLVDKNTRERSRRNFFGEEEAEQKKSPANKRKRDYSNKRPASRDGSVSSRNSGSNATAGKRSKNDKISNKPNDKASKAASRRTSKRNSTDDDSTEVNTANNDTRGMDMYTRHKRELERSLARLEKVDRFGFFFDACPPEFDENYDDADDEICFPDRHPFNLVVLKKRFEAGRYDLDYVRIEMKRRKEIRDALDAAAKTSAQKLETVKEKENDTDVQADKVDVQPDSSEADTQLYDEIARTMIHPVGVDWDTFNSDVNGMCDAAIKRDPQGLELGSGHLGWAANKIKKLMEEMYTNYGCKRRSEMETSEARLKYENILNNSGNMEAAMQGKWRKNAYPERKYERLETSSVVCDGLSEMDKSYAIYELGTSIPDSFVGLAYTYDDSGQHSETWMKNVVDETTAKPRSKRRKKAAGDSDAADENDKNKEHTAAVALANDDGVTKAQVYNTMQSLLIQVQDRVMTDLGVMHQPEARSANWDDGDQRRNYRGGSAEVEQGNLQSGTLPQVAEQEVWGVDCYTRKNVMTLIESEFSAEIALEFMEKWLLPAINSCPVDLAYNISTAAKILEGLPIDDTTEKKVPTDESQPVPQGDALEEATGKVIHVEEAKPSSPRRKAPESSVFLRTALESKIKHSGPPWLKAAARLIRNAADSVDEDDGFFRIHPKGHGSVVIGEQGLKANSLVTYYRGEVYPAWRWCEKLDAIEKTQKDLGLRPNLPDFYNMAMERPMKDPRGYGMLFVDASRKSGLGSSFSHSCNPSCEVRVVALNGKLSLAMTTLRDLEQGEELTFDYNAVTESVNEYRFAICLCGHRKCRGSFLHLTSAPCYQQVLSRNCPMASRFANLVRGCMKQVMSREDSELLLKHGFNTAAFGAVSFNHHSKAIRSSKVDVVAKSDKDARTQLGELLLELSSSPPRLYSRESSDVQAPVIPDSSEDSIENVPIWLRTYVADTLRYIEYERRALPVALLCNQMERTEKQQRKEKRSKDKAKKNASEKILAETDSLNAEKSKLLAASKPQSSYFFFLNNNRERLASIVQEEHGDSLSGLAFSQAVNKEASQAWKNLSEEEKQEWKKKSINYWKKNGGTNSTPAVGSPEEKVNSPSGSNEAIIEQKEISFADAEAEGLSAMEQRIQQLSQSLSRVGRVLDRHRENEYRKSNVKNVNSELLRSLIPSPLKIMSDEEVVNWLWSDTQGVVHNLFAMVGKHFPKQSLLQRLLLNTKATYPVLTAFTAFDATLMHSSVESKKGKNSCTSEDARCLVRDALLEFRSDIINFLTFAENDYFDAMKKKKKDAERRRNEAKRTKKASKLKTAAEKPDTIGDDTVPSEAIAPNDSKAGTLPLPFNIPDAPQPSQGSDANNETSIDESHISDDAMRIRGGGEDVICVETNPPVDVLQSEMGENLSSVNESSAESVPPKKEPLTQNVASTEATISDDAPLQKSTEATISDDAPLQKQMSDMNAPTQQPQTVNSLETDTLKVDVKPEVSHEDRKCVITPSSTESQAKTETSLSIPNAASSHLTAGQLNGVGSTTQHMNPTLVEKSVATCIAQETRQLKYDAEKSLVPSVAMSTNSFSILATAAEVIKSADDIPCPEPEQETKKKKTAPMNQEQVAYLRKWLLDPNHILNPYPTEQEKDKIMSDIGVERAHLERWLSRHRKPIICSPDKEQLSMKWTESEASHWSNFRSQRYMLEATADMLLMYACTNTFFLVEPFNHFDSTPIEVYARELGNEVPLHFAANNDAKPSEIETEVQDTSDIGDSTTLPPRSKSKRDKSNKPEEFCSPEDVITSVTVSYSGEYVLSQLLQWFNGGIGQQSGLPDIFGCIMLPPISGCWEEIKSATEIKAPTHTKANPVTVTEYSKAIRPRLAEWVDDRTKRGSPWNEKLARYYCQSGSSPDPSMPMGSPIVDYLVTGLEDNIQFVSNALRGSDGKGIDSPVRPRANASASVRLQSTVDEGMPAQAVANWVQCENPTCLKWRKLPWHVDIDLLPEKFFCKDNVWTSGKKSCEVPEDKWDMSDAPIKFDCVVEEDFEIGVWFDVQRDGKIGYHEAQVIELDLNSTVKRVKFHFWRLKNASDEWVEVGSPRIAPHHSYTPRPVEGYGVPKKSNKRGGDKSKSGTTDGNTSSLDRKKRKTVEALPYQIKPPESAVAPNEPKRNENPTEAKEIVVTEMSDNLKSAGKGTARKCAPFPKSTVDYLNNWFAEHASNPFPTQEQKDIMMSTTGLDKRQLSDWLAKTRKKKQKLQAEPSTPISDREMVVKAEVPPDKLEDISLLLKLKGTLPVEGRGSGDAGMANLGDGNLNSVSAEPAVQEISGINSSNSPPKPPGTPPSIGLSDEAKVYLLKWIHANKSNPFPTKAAKEKMIKDLGLGHDDMRKIDGWFSRARKKLKKAEESPVFHRVPQTQHGFSGIVNSDGQVIIPPKSEDNVPNASLPGPTKPTSQEVDKYLNEWLSRPENATNFNPSQQIREQIETETGIEKRRIESWFYRLRKKMKAAVNGASGALPTQPNPGFGAVTGSSEPVLKPAPTTTTQPQPISQNAALGMQNQQDQTSSTGLTNLDALLEAASIHSAAKEAYSRMQNEAIASHAAQYNQPIHRPHHVSNQRPPGTDLATMQRGVMRFSPIHTDHRMSPPSYQNNIFVPPHGHAPSVQPSHQSAPHRRPPGSFVPIRSDNSGDPNSSRGSTPTFNGYQNNAQPTYHPARSSPTYIPPHASHRPPSAMPHHSYPRPPNEQPHNHPHHAHMPSHSGQQPVPHREGHQNMETVHYPPRYMHNG